MKAQLLIALFFLTSPATAKEACVVPLTVNGTTVAEVTAESRQSCFDAVTIAQPAPVVTAEALRRGPGGELAIPVDAPVYCKFIPYKMHLKGRGKSRKFWCYRTDGQGRYFHDRYEISEDAARVSEDGSLLDSNGDLLRHEDGAVQKPWVLKVKYTTGGNRGREVYTEVAVSRFLWALGFPSDHMFPARVVCNGCRKDPFREIRSKADNHIVSQTHYFPNASIERKLVRSIETKEDQGWKWEDVYHDSRWDRDKRVEFEAYVLALNMVHFHNGRSKQNTLGCENGHWDRSTGACSKPVAFLDDLGSTFGGGSSRANHRKYRTNTVFRKPGSCTLRADLAGFGQVSEAGRQFLGARLGILDREHVRTIFQTAGFDDENTDASLDEWVAVFMDRIEEVRGTHCGL